MEPAGHRHDRAGSRASAPARSTDGPAHSAAHGLAAAAHEPATPAAHGPASNAAAWALVAPYRSRLIALARARGLSLPDAQDVAHHVMCRAVERGVADPDRVEAHLVRAVVQRCQDVRDDEARQEQFLARTRGDDRLAGRVDDAVCDRAQVRWLLGKLPLRERRVVMLSVSGETVTGIAEATGLSYPTVDRLLSRARKEMRRLAGLAALVGVAAWRHRRIVAPSGATAAAVAVASVTMLAPHTSPAPAEVAPRGRHAVRMVQRVAVEPAVVSRAAGRPAMRAVLAVPVPAVAPAADAAPRRPRRAALPVPKPVDVEAASNPVAHVQECVRDGVSVEVGSRVTVVCG